MQIAGLVAVEIGLDIDLIFAECLILTDNSEEEACAGRRGGEMLHLCGVGGYGDEIGCEAGSRNCASPIVISPHAHCSADTHGQFGIFAHEQEIRCLRVLEMVKLVVIEILDEGAQ